MKAPSVEYIKTVERCIGNEKQECNGEVFMSMPFRTDVLNTYLRGNIAVRSGI